jgi:2-phospho-L-lactate guanylyltransferase
LKINSTNGGSVHAVVPVKALEKSKTRLSSILHPKERAQLTMAMLMDVLSALRKSSIIDSIMVVSTDRNVLRLGQQLGINSLRETPKRGLNGAINQVIGRCKWENSAVLVVHADLPLLTPREVDTFLREAQGCSVTIGPSKDEIGTNAMVLNPARVIRPAFGKESYKRHISILHRKKLHFKVQSSQGFGFDIDEPEDLLELMNHKTRNNTARFLRQIREQDFQKLRRGIQNNSKVRLAPKCPIESENGKAAPALTFARGN